MQLTQHKSSSVLQVDSEALSVPEKFAGLLYHEVVAEPRALCVPLKDGSFRSRSDARTAEQPT